MMVRRKRRALIVFPCTVHGYAGNIARVCQIAALLREGHEIDFFSLVQSSGIEEALAGKGIAIDRIGLAAPVPLQEALRLLYKSVYVANKLLVEKLGVRRHYSFRLFDRLAPLLLRAFGIGTPYDVGIYNYAWTARGMRSLCRRVAVDVHDLHADRHQRLGYRNWVSLSAVDELERLSEVDATIVISEQELTAMRRAGRPLKSVFLPYWPGAAPRAKDTSNRSTHCVFVGSGNPLNANSLLITEGTGVLDILQQLGLKLVVAGAICHSEVARQLSERWPRVIELRGVVPDMAALLSGCSVGLNTCGPSTGLKVKTVDYLAAGLHVISSVDGSDRWLERAFPNRIKVIDVRASRRQTEAEVRCFLERVARAEQANDDARASHQVAELAKNFLAALGDVA